MKLTTILLAGAAMVAATGAQAQSMTTLYDQTNIADQFETPLTINFTATGTSTSLSFAGYNLPDFTSVDSINVYQNGSNTNLLSGNYTFTPAASGSYAFQFGGSLNFGGTTEGDYDTFTTQFASAIGTGYTLGFNLSSEGYNDGEGGEFGGGNGLRVTTSAAAMTTPGAVPEPATWAMMMVGFGMIGFGLRRRSKVTTSVRFA